MSGVSVGFEEGEDAAEKEYGGIPLNQSWSFPMVQSSSKPQINSMCWVLYVGGIIFAAVLGMQFAPPLKAQTYDYHPDSSLLLGGSFDPVSP